MQVPYEAMEQSGRSEFDAAEFVESPEPRAACLLLLDTSASMDGEPIEQLNEGLGRLKSDLQTDPLAAKRAEVAIVTFGGAIRVVQDFATVDRFQAPTLSADGGTPMSQAILQGVDMVARRKQTYKDNGISYYRPWIFLLTDGAPTDRDQWPAAVDRVRRGEQKKEFALFPIGVGDLADLRRLGEFCRPPLKLRGLDFKEYFQWLSRSLQTVSRSKPGEEVNLPSPAGWANVD
jgi:uncharacterized protein YegL